LYKQRYWIEPKQALMHNEMSSSSSASSATKTITKESNLDNWFYLPGWRKSMPGQSKDIAGSKWLIIGDSAGLADLIAQNLLESGAELRIVFDNSITLPPGTTNTSSKHNTSS